MLYVVFLVIGFAALIKGADWFVEGAAKLAGRFGIPQLVIGLTIVAMGTSLPEAAVSIQGAWKGTAGIAVGNVLGSNIFNVLVILGLTALFVAVPLQRSTMLIEIPYMLIVTAAILVLGVSGACISRWDGVILWAMFLLYLGYLWWSARNNKEDQESGQAQTSMTRCVIYLVLGIVLIVAGGQLTVDGACGLARMAGLSERVIGLTIVACGTSLPELMTSIVAARKQHADIAIGNIVGSNIFNILFVIGTAALITPITFEPVFIPDAWIAFGAGVLLWLGTLRRRALSRTCGVLMLICYVLYLVYLIGMPG